MPMQGPVCASQPPSKRVVLFTQPDPNALMLDMNGLLEYKVFPHAVHNFYTTSMLQINVFLPHDAATDDYFLLQPRASALRRRTSVRIDGLGRRIELMDVEVCGDTRPRPAATPMHDTSTRKLTHYIIHIQ